MTFEPWQVVLFLVVELASALVVWTIVIAREHRETIDALIEFNMQCRGVGRWQAEGEIADFLARRLRQRLRRQMTPDEIRMCGAIQPEGPPPWARHRMGPPPRTN